MNYLNIVNNSLNYIEDNLQSNLSINKLAQEFNISQAHFSRVFKFITGHSLKKYINNRRLEKSLISLKEEKTSIINIALNCGYDYPEVFSRAFKKEFGLSPREYRDSNMYIPPSNKISVIKRDLINCNGGITIKPNYTYLDTFKLEGMSTVANINSRDFPEKIVNKTSTSNRKEFYHIISCLGDGENFELFYGSINGNNPKRSLSKKTVKKSWYLSFDYSGDITTIYKTLRHDIESYFRTKKIPLIVKGIGIILHFSVLKPEVVNVLVPINRR